jgi:hypothetical protein
VLGVLLLVVLIQKGLDLAIPGPLDDGLDAFIFSLIRDLVSLVVRRCFCPYFNLAIDNGQGKIVPLKSHRQIIALFSK